MLERLRNQIGTAGLLVAIVALVAALGGGAYAASGGSGDGKASASAKGKKGKQGKRGKPGKQGPAGPAGPAGAAGVAGAPGASGKDGTNGTNGSSGKSIVTAAVAPGADCDEGGTSVEVEGSPATKKYICNGLEGPAGNNGNEGSPWTAGGTLPPGATQTGAWIAKVDVTDNPEAEPQPSGTVTAISFPIPLANELPGAVPGPSRTLIINDSSSAEEKANCDDGEGAAASPANPEADPGYLCVFEASGAANAVMIGKPSGTGLGDMGASTAGASIAVVGLEGEEAVGTFAVTG